MSTQSITEIIDRFETVFSQKVGCVPNIEVTLQLCKGAKPGFCKEREVSFVTLLETSGIIYKVKTSHWRSKLKYFCNLYEKMSTLFKN